MNSTRRGFTLLEILIAMGLFTVLGFTVVLLMRTGVDMWIRGNQGAQQEDRVEQSLPRLEEDLRMVLVPSQRDRVPFDKKNPDPEKEPPALMPDNRFISAYHSYRVGERSAEVACRYLAFVRDITGLGELDMFAARAGTNPKAEAYIDRVDDDEEFKKNNHLPTGGAVEVLWVYVPNDQAPGLGTVYRAYRSPIGGKETLLDPKNHDTPEKLKALKAQAMFQDVILFDVLFWTQYTTHWVWDRDEPRVTERPRQLTGRDTGRQPCGPSRTWDSTRGILDEKGTNGFRLSKGKASANFSADDIWPRMVRIEFALAEEQTQLARPMSGADRTFTVVVSDFATGHGDLFGRLMKVDTEWVRISGRQSARDTFEVERRAERGTTSIDHPEGGTVRFGRVMDVTVAIPSFRDDNN